MKKSLAILASLLLVVALSSCGRLTNALKHFHSSLTGLDRKITLYAGDGRVIKEWRTRAQIEDKGGTVFFVCDGRAVTVAGTFVVEEQ